jgi:hypothetical protein
MLNNLFPSGPYHSKNFIKSLQGVRLNKSEYFSYDPWSKKISFGGIYKIDKNIDFFFKYEKGGHSRFHLNGRNLEEARHNYKFGSFYNPLAITTGFKNEDTSYSLDFDFFLHSDNSSDSLLNRKRFRFREFKVERFLLDDQSLKESNLKEEKLENFVSQFDQYMSDKESSQQAKVENLVEETGSSFEKLSMSNKSLTAFEFSCLQFGFLGILASFALVTQIPSHNLERFTLKIKALTDLEPYPKAWRCLRYYYNVGTPKQITSWAEVEDKNVLRLILTVDQVKKRNTVILKVIIFTTMSTIFWKSFNPAGLLILCASSRFAEALNLPVLYKLPAIYQLCVISKTVSLQLFKGQYGQFLSFVVSILYFLILGKVVEFVFNKTLLIIKSVNERYYDQSGDSYDLVFDNDLKKYLAN